MIIFRRPSCPKFHKPGMRALVTQGEPGLETQSECPAFYQAHRAVELTDPMESTAINAWLHGQLTAPT